MRVEITPGVATGTVSAPNSKSMAHRMLICAALAKGKSVIHGVPECDDVTATMECLSLLGARFEYNKDTVTVYGTDVCNASPVQALYCKESGSTLRFLIPVCLLCGKNLLLTGAESLFRRPLDAYEELSREKGFVFSQDGNSVMLRGPITAGEYRISGSVSSQFISGLLFALPLLEKDSVVNIIPPVVSRPYIELTLQALKEFGVDACWTDDHTILVKGGKGFVPTETTVEGDYSGASFYAALNSLGGNVNILGLREDSLQGDKIYEKHFALLQQGIPTVHIWVPCCLRWHPQNTAACLTEPPVCALKKATVHPLWRKNLKSSGFPLPFTRIPLWYIPLSFILPPNRCTVITTTVSLCPLLCCSLSRGEL